MSEIAFESLETSLKTLFSRVFLANSISAIFFIYISSFPDIHLFLINYNLVIVCKLFLPISTRLLVVSARFYLLTSRFHYFLLVYHLSVASTRLRVVSTYNY